MYKKNIKTHINQRLQRIANVLLLNSSFSDNIGLLNGKLGISIFFYHYARYTSNEIYENYAGELIDEIYDEIKTDGITDFTDGLTGIGWGIEYLVKHRFVEADTDDALKEIDRALYRTWRQKPVLIENSSDLFGYGLYFLARLYDRENLDVPSTLLKKHLLIFLTDECERVLINKRFLEFTIPILNVAVLNSIAMFGIEMHKLGLYPTKVEKLFHYLVFYCESPIMNFNSKQDCITLLQLIQSIEPLVDDPEIKQKCQFLVRKLTKFQDNSETNPDLIVNQCCKQAWHQLIYAGAIKENTFCEITEKAFTIIDNEDYWNQFIRKLNNKNLGLNNGLAGMGLALLQLAEKNVNLSMVNKPMINK